MRTSATRGRRADTCFSRYTVIVAAMHGGHLMTADSTNRLATYDELGAHRRLLISQRLRLRRRELGLTQKEVVVRLRQMGVLTTNKALSSLEHGVGIDVCKLPEIARALDCSLTYLVGLTNEPADWEPDFEHWPGQRGRSGPVPDQPSPRVVRPLD
jgi:transcriptional regulator with XRE-family HTH domain